MREVLPDTLFDDSIFTASLFDGLKIQYFQEILFYRENIVSWKWIVNCVYDILLHESIQYHVACEQVARTHVHVTNMKM